jgi:hypothetical protein
MKTKLALVLLPVLALCANLDAKGVDSATQTLNSNGTVAIKTVGPYVEIGTFQIQVSTKLGRPDLTLADGTWLYHHRRIDGSAAEGTLVVRFAAGRVSALTLATPQVVAALRRTSPTHRATTELVATK